MYKKNVSMFVFVLLVFFVTACADTTADKQASDGDQDLLDTEEMELDLDSSENEQELEKDVEQETDFDIEPESEMELDKTEQPFAVFGTAMDGKLYAAAGSAIITPTDVNHPCTKYMGGTGSERLSTDTHDDLEIRFLILEQNTKHAVLISADLIGLIISDVDMVWDRLEAEMGVDRNSVIISSTHTHEAPDTIGIWGVAAQVTGRCPEYIEFLVDTIVNKVKELKSQMTAVTLYAGETEINEPASNHKSLIRDSRIPIVINNRVTVAKLLKEDDSILATIVNWHSHPEVLISLKEYSADFPRFTRERVEQELGGTCIYFSGTVGGLANPLGVDVPMRDENGNPVFDGDKPVLAKTNTDDKLRSMGYIVAEYALKALKDAEIIEPNLQTSFKRIVIPFDNFVFVLAFELEMINPYDELIFDKEKCPLFACMPQNLIHIGLGKLHFVSLPGESLAESSIGREASSYDWGGEWGVHEYDAITGWRDKLPEGHFLMELGLANNEIGYILPINDYEEKDHPNNYEEYFSFSNTTEQLVRDAIEELLEDSLQ